MSHPGDDAGKHVSEPASRLTGDDVVPALAHLRSGQPLILVDDPARSNGANYVLAGQFCSTEHVAFMARVGHGLIAVPMPESRADRLALPPVSPTGADQVGTAFSVSVEAVGVTTGVSATERAHTIRVLADPTTTAADLRRPGHVHPIRARDGGVLVRPRYSEACVDVCRLAGLEPVAVTCRIVRPDGTIASPDDLRVLAREHDMRILAVEDLVAYRMRTEQLVERVEEAALPTPYGDFRILGYRSPLDTAEHLALVMGETRTAAPVLVHLHRRCLSGDVFGSQLCGCRDRLRASMATIGREGAGAIIYLQASPAGGWSHPQPVTPFLPTETVSVNSDEARAGFLAAQILAELGIEEARLVDGTEGASEVRYHVHMPSRQTRTAP